MKNMLVIPPKEVLADFTPDFTIYNAGKSRPRAVFPCFLRSQVRGGAKG